MSKTVVNVAKGMIAGVVVGTAVSVISGKVSRPQNKFRKGAGKTLESISHVMHNMAELTK